MGKGKGKKSKKPLVPSKKVNVSSRSDEPKKDDTKISVGSKVNQSLDLHCGLCGTVTDGLVWFVQCDDCDEHFHFTCVGITEIRDEDPWSCDHCQRKKEKSNLSSLASNNVRNSGAGESTNRNLSTANQLPTNDTSSMSVRSMQRPRTIVVKADVNVRSKPAIENASKSLEFIDIDHDQLWNNALIRYKRRRQKSISPSRSQSVPNQFLNAALAKMPDDVNAIEVHDDEDNGNLSHSPTTAQHRENHKKTSTRVPSVNPRLDYVRPESNLSKIRSTTSSQRSAASLERIQAELELQTQLDEEVLALKLEAVKLKEARMRKFMDEKYKVTGSQVGSVRSQNTHTTNRTSYVSSWVEDQQKYAKSKSLDLSIPQKITRQPELVTTGVEGIKPVKAKSVDDNVRETLKKIDEFNFDWSVTLDPEEKTMLTQLLRKSAISPMLKSGTVPDSNIDRTSKHRQTLKENATMFVPSQGTLNGAMRNQEHQPVVARFNPSHDVDTGNQIDHLSQSCQNQYPTVSTNRDTTYLCQTQNEPSHQIQPWCDPSFANRRPIASTLVTSYQPKVNPHPTNQVQFVKHTQPWTDTPYCHSKPVNPTFIPSHQINPRSTKNDQFTQQSKSMSNKTHPQNQPTVSTRPTSSYQNAQPIIQDQHRQPPCNQAHQPWSTQNQLPNRDSLSYSRHGVPRVNIRNESSNSDCIQFDYRAPLTENQIAARQVMGKEPLPFFDGNPAQWRRFIKGFETITENCGLSNVESLKKLDKCLLGKAREIVECQLTMPECVPEIIETLRQKFGRPEFIIKTVLADIRSVPAIKTDKLEALSDYGYKVRNVYKTIESLNMHYHLYNPELIQELVDKMPHQTKIDWARHSEEMHQVSLVDFSNWLYKLSQSINRITMPEVSVTSSDRKSDRNPENSKNGYINVHDNNEIKNVTTYCQSEVSKCAACTKNCKFIGECPKFKELLVDARWKLLIENNLCRRCLKRHGPRCNVAKECGKNGCKFKHNFLLHDEKRHEMSKSSQSNESTEPISVVKPSATANIVNGISNTHYVDEQDTLFRIAPVVLRYKNESLITFAFLDEGSSFTLMERHIAEQLKLKGTPETICLLWTKKVHRQEQSELVDLEISSVNVEPSVKYPLKSVNVVDDLNLPSQSMMPTELARRYPHLKDLPLVGFQKITPTIMIGLKHARLMAPLEIVEGGENDPIATRSRLGWSVYGPTDDYNVGYVNTHRVTKCPCQDRDDKVHDAIKEHFSIENFGVAANPMCLDSKENELALESLKKFTVRKGNRFETRLLWKNRNCELPDSYPMAVKRLTCLENKGAKAINTINESVEDYLKKGYVSKLTPAEATIKTARTWYLPLFTAIHPKKPEKLRTVFDGAARTQGVSLNSTLYTGPDLLISIVDILRRFREKRIAICGDIKEMYHQVLVHEDDRHSQRFLWRHGEKDREPDVYVMNVMTFGATCSPSAAQYVKNVNASEFQSKYPRAAEAIIKNHYVDDMMDGTETVEEAIQLVNDVKFVHSQGGFEIRNFKSNSLELLAAIGEPVNSQEKVSVENELNLERVLGMFWDTKSDSFTFSLKFTKVSKEILTGNQLPTKREALRLLMSIFDPLGLLSYYLIHLKILLQDVWRSKIKWDDQIPKELSEKWMRWVEILPKVTGLMVPRWYSVNLSPKLTKRVEMHIFVDAGEDAFAAVAYLRIESAENCECSIIGSKARVSPLKYLSTPRKELMGSILGSRLSNSIQDGLSTKIDRRIIWTDSHTVLTWLHSEHRKYSQFVAHRVGEILENTNLNEWRWVPTKLNVADEATKWTKPPTFESSNRWFTAPEFLNLPESEWPKMVKKIIPNGTTEEMRLSCSHSRLVLPSIVDPTRFSKWSRLIRAIAYATRFVNILVAIIRKSRSPQGPLTQMELMTSEKILFRQAQWEIYTEEMVILVRNQKLIKEQRKCIAMKSEISDCLPYLDEFGLLRVKGRIDEAQALTMDAKRPIILPRNHKITKLLMDDYHVKFMHQNHESVVNELRQRFYIPRIRTALNSVRWNCKVCALRRCQPRPPQMADLPAIRFEPGVRPFTYTGIDYFGPITVMVGRRTEKRWGVLMTCLTIRAIHIEIAHSLNTESCILCVRNFVSLRGRPSQIYSDCGTNLKSADTALREELKKLDVEELSKAFTSSYTRWNFNPPASPHMGGTWERLIRTFKSCLSVSMTDRTPRDEVLRNLFMEVMNIVNSRPLTFVPVRSDDQEALTPNHFLLGTSNGLKPPGKFNSDGPYIRAGWKEVQRCTNVFWNRFITEYTPTLTRRTKWFDAVKPLAIGDLVLHMDPSSPRNTYDRARIVDTVVGSNDQVRRAKIQFGDGSTLWRPAVRLALLDVQDHDLPTSQNGLDQHAPTSQDGLDPPSGIETGGNNVGATNPNPKSNRALVRNGTKPSTSNTSPKRQLRSKS